jgi:hypothetical protein
MRGRASASDRQDQACGLGFGVLGTGPGSVIGPVGVWPGSVAGTSFGGTTGISVGVWPGNTGLGLGLGGRGCGS